jgi:hypothetical protein
VPLTLPPFTQFQAPLFPLRGLWRARPEEGDRFINAEIAWGTPGLTGVSCVQFQLSGNSPVAFSQIVAMSVDNSRCGSNVDFVFPDSGFILSVPGYNQGVYPVFTNALMFYANGPLAVLGDVTIVQILNSMPPPVAIQPASEQTQAGVGGVNLGTNGSTQIVPNTISGTIQTIAIEFAIGAGVTGAAQIQLIDGNAQVVWSGIINPDAASPAAPLVITGLHIRFQRGLSFVISASSIAGGTAQATINVYYAVP